MGIFVVFGLFTLFSKAQAVNAVSSKRVELKTVQSKIVEKTKNLSQLQGQKQDVNEQLAEVDKKYAQLVMSLKLLQRQVDQKNRKLQQTQLAISNQQLHVDEQKHDLATQVGAAYKMGQHDHLKLILNQEDLALSSRILVYYDYLNKMRLKKVEQIDQELKQLGQLESQLELDNADYLKALKQKKLDQAQLWETKQARTVLLNQISNKYYADQQALDRLRKDEQRLQSLLELLQREVSQQSLVKFESKSKIVKQIVTDKRGLSSLEKESLDQSVSQKRIKIEGVAIDDSKQEMQSSPSSQRKQQSHQKDIQVSQVSQSVYAGSSFNELRGQLFWPVRGKMLKTFGSIRLEGRWDGVLIGAPAGQNIRVVAGGRVVFASWLRGYGLLIIVNHGGGFMTVYAFNESLYKGVGATVKAGEAIASIGQSGGQPEPALYFEIRQQGRPLDPSLWCKK